VDIRDLVSALIQRDALRARQWVADAERAGFDWSRATEPQGLDAIASALAAGLVEVEALPRLRRLCEQEGPEPLRRRGLLAPPDFLTAA
jgi:hypothetical protein